jgi:hypothetical protein
MRCCSTMCLVCRWVPGCGAWDAASCAASAVEEASCSKDAYSLAVAAAQSAGKCGCGPTTIKREEEYQHRATPT